MNLRRCLLLALGAGLSGRAVLSRAQASTAKVRRVGVLSPSTRAREEVTLAPFFDEMRRLGWIEGRNVEYDWVAADDQQQSLPRLAADMVARKPEEIFAPPTPATLAAKQATPSIPIVFAAVLDPGGIGLVASLARPGGNVTGIVSYSESLQPKRIELLRAILPGVKRIGLLGDVNDPAARLDRQALAPVAASSGLTIAFAEAANPVEFDAAVAALVAERVEVISVVGTGALAYNLRARLKELATLAGVTSDLAEQRFAFARAIGSPAAERRGACAGTSRATATPRRVIMTSVPRSTSSSSALGCDLASNVLTAFMTAPRLTRQRTRLSRAARQRLWWRAAGARP